MFLFTRCKISLWYFQCIYDVLAQNTWQIILYSLLKLPLLGCETKRADFEYVALNANTLLLLEKKAELQELSASLLQINIPINTSLLSLQKTYSVIIKVMEGVYRDNYVR